MLEDVTPLIDAEFYLFRAPFSWLCTLNVGRGSAVD
jgi:hypothetical protein